MIDVHTHILPEVDDGSSSVEESLQMLQSCVAQGIEKVVLTPHFYADQDTPERFLLRRARAVETLQQEVRRQQLPIALQLGSEVHFYRGIGCSESIQRLAIENTNCILVELPFSHGNKYADIAVELRELKSQGLQVILAHVERYITRWNQDRVLSELQDTGAYLQCNAEFFIGRTQKRAIHLLKQGKIHLLGSDCHNMTERIPNLRSAMDIIQDKAGADELEQLEQRAVRLLGRNGVR